MLTIRKIKMKCIATKSNFFTLSKRQKESYRKTIEELAFTSMFEQDIFTSLENNYLNKSWILEATVIFLAIICSILEIVKLIFLQ